MWKIYQVIKITMKEIKYLFVMLTLGVFIVGVIRQLSEIWASEFMDLFVWGMIAGISISCLVDEVRRAYIKSN